MLNTSVTIKNASKVIGYFSYTSAGGVFCDEDACVVAGSSASLQRYLQQASLSADEKDGSPSIL